MRMPSNTKNIHKCKHQQWSTCKADDVIGSLHKHFTDINCFKKFKILSKIYSLQQKYPLNVFTISWHQIIPGFFVDMIN